MTSTIKTKVVEITTLTRELKVTFESTGRLEHSFEVTFSDGGKKTVFVQFIPSRAIAWLRLTQYFEEDENTTVSMI